MEGNATTRIFCGFTQEELNSGFNKTLIEQEATSIEDHEGIGFNNNQLSTLCQRLC